MSPSVELNGVADERSSSGRNTPKENAANSSKFTTSNFVETIVTQSESVFGHESTGIPTTAASFSSTTISKSASNSSLIQKNVSQSKSGTSTFNKTSNHTSKKRKTGARTPTALSNENSNQSVNSDTSGSLVVNTNAIVQQVNNSNIVQTTLAETTNLNTISESEQTKKVINFNLFFLSRTNNLS